MPNHDQQSLIAVLEQKLKDIERRVTGMETTSKVLLLLVLTTVIGTVLKTIGVG